MGIESRKMAVVSPANLTRADAVWLDLESRQNAGSVERNEIGGHSLGTRFGALNVGAMAYGWVCWIPTEETVEEIPERLAAIFERCREEGFDYVLIDQDAEPIEGLPVYDW